MENTKLRTQAEVNEFAGTEIKGNLTIEGSDIYDLSPLLTLNSVSGNLLIWHNDSLTNLDGLSSLTLVSGVLEIRNNSALTNLDGLRNISSVNGA